MGRGGRPVRAPAPGGSGRAAGRLMPPPGLGRRIFPGGLAGSLALAVGGGGLPAAMRAWLEAPLGDLTPGDGFHFYSVTGSIPSWDRVSWRLAVDGLVERPLRLGLDDLLARPLVAVRADFRCGSGWSVPDARWEGIPGGGLLGRAGGHGRAGAG